MRLAALGAVGIVLGLVAIAAFGQPRGGDPNAPGGPRGGPGATGDLYVPLGGSADAVAQFDGVTGDYVGDFVTSGLGGLGEPVGIAFDEVGNLYVGSYATDEILRYDGTTGAFIDVFVSAGSGGLNGPYGLTFGPEGNLYVCSFLTNEILSYDGVSGASLGVFVSNGVTYPVDLAFGPGGDLYVSSYSGNNVLRYDGLTGSLIGAFAAGGGLSGACGLEFGPGGDLYVAGYNNDAVLRYDGVSGAFVEVFASGGGLDGAFGVAFGPDSGNLVASGYESDSVIEYDGADGSLIGTFVSGVSSPGLLRFKPLGSGSYPAPDVTDFQPATAGNSDVLVGATITGTGLVAGAELKLTRDGEADIPGVVTGVVPDTEITANFDLTGVALGWWDLILTYPDEQTDTLVDAVEVVLGDVGVTEMTPSKACACCPLPGVTITGIGFVPGTTVTLTKAGEADIVGTNVVVQSYTTIVADFDLTDAAIGLWDLTVTRPDMENATLGDALEVTQTFGELAAPGDLYVAISAHAEGRVFQFDGVTGELVGTFVPHNYPAEQRAKTDLAFGPNGNLYVTFEGWVNSIIEYDGDTGERVQVIEPAERYWSCALFGADGYLYVASSAAVRRYDVTIPAPLGVFATHTLIERNLYDLVFGGPSQNLFVAALNDLASEPASIVEFDGSTGAFWGTVAHQQGVHLARGLAFGQDGNLLATNRVNVIEVDPVSGDRVGTLAGAAGLRSAGAIVVGPRGDIYVADREQLAVFKFDGQTGASLGRFAAYEFDPPIPYNYNEIRGLTFKPCRGLAPEITGLSPTQADNCGAVTLTIGGDDLHWHCLTAELRRDGYADIDGEVIGGCRPDGVQATFDLLGAAPGAWDVLLAYADTEAVLAGALVVSDGGACAGPTLDGFDPAVADNCTPLVGATITGSGFVPGTTVKLTDGVTEIPGELAELPAATQIVADFDLTEAAAGSWDLVVTNPDTQSATLPAALTVVADCLPPVVTRITPDQVDNCFHGFHSSADIDNGQVHSYEITGHGFQDGATVRLSLAGETDVEATNVEVASSTLIIADFFDMGNLTGGAWDVTVTNPDAQSGTLAAGLLYDHRDDCPHGEAYDWVHLQQCAGTSVQFYHGLQTDSDGNLVVFRILQLSGGEAADFVKVTPAGEVLWEAPNMGLGRTNAFALDGDDNIVQWGDHGSVSGEAQCDELQFRGIWLCKYDPDGNLLWQREYTLPWPLDMRPGEGGSPNLGGVLIPGGDLYVRVARDEDCSGFAPPECRRLRFRVSDGELLDWYSEPVTTAPGCLSEYYLVKYRGADAAGCYYTWEPASGCPEPDALRKYCGSELAWERTDMGEFGYARGDAFYDFKDMEVSAGGYDYMHLRITRYDTDGNVVWSRDYAPPDGKNLNVYKPGLYDDKFNARVDRYGNLVLLATNYPSSSECPWWIDEITWVRFSIDPENGDVISWVELEGLEGLHWIYVEAFLGPDAGGSTQVFVEDDWPHLSGSVSEAAVRVKSHAPDGQLVRDSAWNYPRRVIGAVERAWGIPVLNRQGDLFATWILYYDQSAFDHDPANFCDLNAYDYAFLGVPSSYEPGDPGGDGVFGLDDFAVFADCMSGPAVTPDPPLPTTADDCLIYFDLDNDGDVDLADYAILTGGQRPALGACCLDAGGCELTTQPSCVGEFMGVGTTCESVYCEGAGACCRDDGTCEVTLPWLCSGEFQGEGTTCEMVDCPVGACCLADGSCVEVAPWACNGEYQGDGTTCDSVTCSLGACCLPDGSCIDVAGWACTGAYQGDGTECSLDSCPGGRYQNEIDPITSYIAAGAGLQLADDLTLEGAGWRDLVYVDLLVYGGGGGMFNVTVELYTACPGAGGTLIPGTTFTWTDVADDGYGYLLDADPIDPPITIPDTVWMVVTFSTPQACWVIAEEAEVGFTADRFGKRLPPWDCNYSFSGNPYAGMWANLECVESGGKARGDGGGTRLSIERVEAPAALRVIEAGE